MTFFFEFVLGNHVMISDAVIEIYRRADGLTTVAMHSVCKQWNTLITAEIFRALASRCIGVTIMTWWDACGCVATVCQHKSSVSKLPGLPLVLYAFSSSILIRRLSHCHNVSAECLAAAGGNMDVIGWFTHGFNPSRLERTFRTAAKYHREVFYQLLALYDCGYVNRAKRDQAISRAVRLGGADAAERIRGIVNDKRIACAIYIGALQRGDAELAALVDQSLFDVYYHDECVAVCKGGSVDLAKIIFTHNKWLEYACYYGHDDLIKYLLEAITNDPAHITEDYPQECFSMACAGGHIAAVKLIMPWALQHHDIEQLRNVGLCNACNYDRKNVIVYMGELGATICDNCSNCVSEHK